MLDTNLDKGLSEDQAKVRLAKYGPNRVTRRPGTPAWKSFLLQFHQPLIYILLLAGATTATGLLCNDSQLWINMTTAVLLGITLAFETREPDLMDRPPRPPRAPLLSVELLMRTGLVSLLMLAAAFGIFLWKSYHGATIAQARTATVNVIIFVGIFYLFNCRSLLRPILSLGLFSNRWLLAGVAAMIIAQLAFTYVPFMNVTFHSRPLDADSWLRLIAVAFAVSMIVAFEKRLRARAGTHREDGAALEPAAQRM